ncbi:hypothetical protein LOK49_LG02G01457 [Camellia lanceoleosa]|uniref:Uncharacterized protein n=1 Tax=Camellia lanceoleosa TaxID=1840588 RepID=A0ACC0IJA0_9ERIC|nr:hypothetical protein LOK49_LG02G01457 [Camellia lanceoleosa]
MRRRFSSLLAVDAVARRRSFPPLVRASTTVDAAAGLSEEEEKAEAKIGARVRVKVPLKVYHVPRVPEIDLTGKEGVLKHVASLVCYYYKRREGRWPVPVLVLGAGAGAGGRSWSCCTVAVQAQDQGKG